MKSRFALLAAAAIVAAVFQIKSAEAALPSLTLAELQKQADTIITGRAVDMKSRLDDRGSGIVNRQISIKLEVKSVEKGAVAANIVAVTTWVPEKRPSGFAGPQGQSFLPNKGDMVRVFCQGKAGGAHIVLIPNGIIKIGSKDKGKGKTPPPKQGPPKQNKP